MSSINFDNPWLLLIAIPLFLLILVPFFIAVRKDNRNVHNVISCVLHLLIAVCVTFSVAGTTVKSALMETDIYVVADVSYSTNKSLDVMDDYIADLENDLPLNAQLGVVCFGATGEQVVHTRLGEPLQSVKGALEQVDYTSTDIVSALQYTSKIFKAGVIKRIVLITDAKQSDESDPDALKRTVDALHQQEIYVDAIYFDSNLKEGAQEVQLSNVEYSQSVYQGRSSTASVYLQSSVATTGTLKLTRDGEEVWQEQISISVGTTVYPVQLSAAEAGQFSYEVILADVEKDTSGYNNSFKFTQRVDDSPITLFITDSEADALRAREIYGTNFEGSVTVMSSEDDIPYTVGELCEYDEIVLSNVNVTNVNNYQMFVESLDTVVSLMGKSLLAFGDIGLQNNVNEYMLRLGNILPVSYGPAEKTEKLFVISIDASNSMMQVGRMAVAKKAAKQMLDLLDDKDMVSVVKFDGSSKIIQSPVAAANREVIKLLIDDIEDRHGTVISGSLNIENGAGQVVKEFGKNRQSYVYLITDGINLESDWTSAKQYAKDLYLQHDAKTSILAVKPQKPEGSTVDPIAEMKKLVSDVGGTYLPVANDTELDDSVFPTIASNFGEAISNRNSAIVTNRPKEEVLNGVDLSGVSGSVCYVKGYVVSDAKMNAISVLNTKYQQKKWVPDPDNPEVLVEKYVDVDVPLYTYWNYGNGKAASFTAPFSGEWISSWNGSDVPFFRNVLNVNTPEQSVSVPFVTTVRKQSGRATLEVRPAEIKPNAKVQVSLIAPDGTRTDITGIGGDASIYSCSFLLSKVGEYKAEVTYQYQEEICKQTVYISVPYLTEYDGFVTFDASPLYKMLGGNGTVSEDGWLHIENDENEVGMRVVNLTIPFMITAVALFMVDIIVRKMKWADITGLFRKHGKEGKK